MSRYNSSNIAEFIERAIAVHGNKYNYDLVDYKTNDTKVAIVCKDHGVFYQAPAKHILLKNGCPTCGGSLKLTTEIFIEQARQVHGNFYDYSKVEYKNARTGVVIVCPKHGDFKQSKDSHINKRNRCRKCNKEEKYATTEFIEQARQVHGDKYDYSKAIYKGCAEKMIIICPIHGEFEQSKNHHVDHKHGCQECGNHVQLTTESFIVKAKLKHGDTYDYSSVDYVDSQTKVIIICNKHGEFKQTPNAHLNSHLTGNGCPKCAKFGGFSKMQIQWLTFMETYLGVKIQHMGNSSEEFCIPNTRLKADGYCEETNTVFEFNGDFWHGNPKVFDPSKEHPTAKCTMQELYDSTLNREQRIRDLGYNLVVMWEHDWKLIIKTITGAQVKFRKTHMH